MFVLTVMEDTVAIKAHQLGSNLETVVKQCINDRLANKVIPGVGLCICLYDLLSVGVSYILPGNGDGHTRVKFRYVVFRPFRDEVLEAKVVGSNRDGLTLSLGFFEDIRIPAAKLPEPHRFEEAEQVWYWEYGSEEEGAEPAKLYMDPGKQVRFRIVENIFKDVKPEVGEDGTTMVQKELSYEIVGSMSEPGLGCVAWWVTEQEQEEEGEPDDMEEE